MARPVYTAEERELAALGVGLASLGTDDDEDSDRDDVICFDSALCAWCDAGLLYSGGPAVVSVAVRGARSRSRSPIAAVSPMPFVSVMPGVGSAGGCCMPMALDQVF